MCVPGAGFGEVPDGCWAKLIVETKSKLKSEKRNVASPEEVEAEPEQQLCPSELGCNRMAGGNPAF